MGLKAPQETIVNGPHSHPNRLLLLGLTVGLLKFRPTSFSSALSSSRESWQMFTQMVDTGEANKMIVLSVAIHLGSSCCLQGLNRKNLNRLPRK